MILYKKTLDWLAIIINKDFEIIFKNFVQRYKDNKDILLPNDYIMHCQKKHLYYK